MAVKKLNYLKDNLQVMDILKIYIRKCVCSLHRHALMNYMPRYLPNHTAYFRKTSFEDSITSVIMSGSS